MNSFYKRKLEIQKLKQTCTVFQEISNLFNSDVSMSFRYLIYNRLGFKRKDYCSLYCAGGQDITNIAYDREDLIKTKMKLHLLVKKAYEEGKCNQTKDFSESESNKELQEIVEKCWQFAIDELEDSKKELDLIDKENGKSF